MELRITFAFLTALMSTAVYAATVPLGCAEPTTSSVGRSFFVDPEKGDKANDGSAEKPWRTLAEVLDPSNHLIATKSYLNYSVGDRTLTDVNRDGPIRPGDVIYLMSGHHGSPIIRQYVNVDFISVVAAANEIPIIDSLVITGSSRWLFRGLKFQGVHLADHSSMPLIDIAPNGFFGADDNLIFIGNTISTEDDAESWSPSDWVDRPFAVGLSSGADCVTISRNHFFNLRNAIGIAGNNSLVEGNLIDHFGNDGIDFAASNITLRKNIIRDGHHTPAEQLHPDAIQGWTTAGATNRDTVIDSNMIINKDNSHENYLQGISIFDGKWNGLTVMNNVVVTNTWHGIALYGVENALIVNNTVVPSSPAKFPTWIIVHDSKDMAPSKNVVVRNNISSQLLTSGDDITVDHNIAQQAIVLPSGGRGAGRLTNVIDPYIYATLSKIDNTKGEYDLRPKANSRAIAGGYSEKAPTVDITGKERVAPIDIGAYAR